MDNIRRISELSSPSEEPVSLTEVKAHLRISNAADDTWLTAAIKAARLMAEDYTHTAFIQRTFRQLSDGIGAMQNQPWWDGMRQAPVSLLSPREIELLRPPLVSVQSIKVYDDNDVPVTVDSTAYYVDNTDQLQYGRVILRRGQSWPVVMRVANGMEINFTAGFSANASGLPADVKQAVLMVVSWMYENRGDCGCDTVGAKSAIAPSGAAMILDSYRLVRF